MKNIEAILENSNFYEGVLKSMQEINPKVNNIKAESFDITSKDDTIIDFVFDYDVKDISTIYLVKKNDETWKIKTNENLIMCDRGLVRYDRERNNFTILDNSHISGDAPIDVTKSTLVEIVEGNEDIKSEIEKAVEKKFASLGEYQNINGFEFNFDEFENFDEACITSHNSFNI